MFTDLKGLLSWGVFGGWEIGLSKSGNLFYLN